MINIKTIILARGGSKGIPQKNIINLNGKPLIAYTIESAKKSRANNIYVSTNCNNIKNIAIQYGAKVISRPENMSEDSSKSEEALIHFSHNQNFDILVFIQPTSPLLLPEDINAGLDMISIYDSVFSAYKEHWVPRWNINATPPQKPVVAATGTAKAPAQAQVAAAQAQAQAAQAQATAQAAQEPNGCGQVVNTTISGYDSNAEYATI